MTPPLLVATDGTDAALGALYVARKLELRRGWRVRVVGVVEPIPVFDTGFAASLPEARIREDRRRALEDRASAQIETVGADTTTWDLSIVDGRPAHRIVEAARAVDARAILLGLGEHAFVDRMLGSETLLTVVRLSHRPVLGVPAGTEDLPHRGVVAVDFSELSRRAARSVTDFLKDPGQIHLVHVISGFDALPQPAGDWRDAYRSQTGNRLRMIRQEITVDDEWTIVTSVRSGDAADELTAYADEVEAGLIALGSHGHSPLGRLILGSVSTRVVRRTDGSVLVIPPAEPAPGFADDEELRDRDREWRSLLTRFADRNRGRPVTLELADPDLGVQPAGSGFHLRDVEYEPRSARILILLARPGEERDHLTHGISSPVDVEVTSGGEAGEEALMIDLERGAILLRVIDGT